MHVWSPLPRVATLSVVFTGWSVLPAVAHEFWIEPETHVVDVGETVQAELRVGSMLSG